MLNNKKIMLNQMVCLLLGCVFLTLSCFSLNVNATTANYSVSPIKSDKQNNLDASYFDLKLKPNETDTLKLAIVNNSNKSIKICTTVDHTSTNSNGVVEYKNSQNFQSSQLTYQMQDLINPNNDLIQLKPYEQRIISYEIKAPPQSFQGVISGGINFTEIETEKTNTSQGMAIKNQLGYSIAVLIHGENEIDKAKVEIDNIKLNQTNGTTAIVVPIMNQSPIFLNKLSVNATVKKGKEIVYIANKNDAQQAPNSVYNYPIEIENQDLSSGEYTVEISLSSKGKKWNFEKELTIKDKTAQKLNNSRLKPPNKLNVTKILLGIVVVVFVILIGCAIFLKKHIKRQ